MGRWTVAVLVVVALGLGAVVAAPASRAQEPQEEAYSDLFEEGIELLQARRFDDAVETFRKAIRLRPDLPEAYYNIACAYSLKGEKEKAVDWLAESMARGFRNRTHIDQDDDLDAIRGEPKYKALMARWFGTGKSEDALITLSGEPASLEKLKGSVVIVDVWRTWCGPCKDEIPELVALQKEYGPKGLIVVGISDEDPGLVEKFADEMKINYTLLRQAGKLPAPLENVRVFPTKFILDREGKVAKKLVGAGGRAELEEIVRPLLGAAAEEKKPEPKPGSEPQVF